MLQKQDRAESFYLQTLLTISCSNLRMAVNSPPSWFGASFPLPSVGQGSLTSPSSGPPEAVSGDPPASCVLPLMETSLQRQRPLRSSGIPSSPLSLHRCPPPASPQPGQAQLGSRRPPLVRAERWEPSARLAENPVGPFASFTAGPWASAGRSSREQPAATDLPAQHTPRGTRGCADQGSLPGPARRLLPAGRPAGSAQAGLRREEPSEPTRHGAQRGAQGGTWACGPLSAGSAARAPHCALCGDSADAGGWAQGERAERWEWLSGAGVPRGRRQAGREQAGPPHPSAGAAAAALARQRAAERDAVPEKLRPSCGPALPPSRLEPLQGPPPRRPHARGPGGPYVPADPGLVRGARVRSGTVSPRRARRNWPTPEGVRPGQEPRGRPASGCREGQTGPKRPSLHPRSLRCPQKGGDGVGGRCVGTV